jgi:hypothetical protein
MRGMGRTRGVVGTACALAWLAAAAPAHAVSFTLTPEQRAEAVRVGQRSVVLEDWTGEWRVGERSGPYAVVMTPFHRLALAARNAAFKHEDLKPKDVESVVKGEEGRLTVWAVLRGPRVDFARFFLPALQAGAQEVKPSFVQNERTAAREEDGQYTARCLYVFPADALDPQGTVTLLVRDAEAKPVARFTVNLSAMR